MAVTANLYGKAYQRLLAGDVNVLSDTLKMALVQAAHTPDLDAHDYFNDITNEASGTGYTAGGQALASKTVTLTAAASWSSQWTANTAYAVGDVVRKVSSNGHLYRCIVAGTSHASVEPTFPTTSGATVTDNTVTWAEIGRSIVVVDAADPSWASSEITARYGVVYKDTGSAATSPLLMLVNFGIDYVSQGGPFTVTLPALGLWNHATP